MHAHLRLMTLLVVLATLFSPGAFAADEKPLPPLLAADRIDGPPLVTAKAWAIADGKTGKLLWGADQAKPLPMASTTKIMTAWIVLEIAAADPKLLDETVVISERSAKTGGSTAKLRAGERYVLSDLLYGLLLPSGNDAAVALAEHVGPRLLPPEAAKDGAVAAFVAEMNQRAKALEMKETKYLDPHGNSGNKSSARDLAVLAFNAWKNPLFRRYVGTRRHTCTATDAQGEQKPVTWDNTNRLLAIEGFDGMKTGTTGGAGSCLVSSGQRNGDRLFVVILGSTSNDSRYIDTRNLFRWAWRERERTGSPAGSG